MNKSKILKNAASILVTISAVLICNTPSAQASTIPIISSSESSAYAVKSDGTVWSWGYNAYGRLGNNSTIQSLLPVQVKNLTGPIAVASGGSSIYALKSDGTVWAWGQNNYGQLGNGLTSSSLVPSQISTLTGITSIAAGINSAYALKSDGTVWSWGYNDHGQLGNNSTSMSSKPLQISGLVNVVYIASGGNSAYAIKSDGTVWGWGSNDGGQLGNNSTTDSRIPIQISSLSGITSIAPGIHSTYALKSDGTVWSWGENICGELGNNSTIRVKTPAQIGSLTNVKSLSGGLYSAYALKYDGTVWSWGSNSNGQLGNNSTTNSSIPIQISSLSDVTSIASHAKSAYALKSDGTIWSWGYNDHGQLGINSIVDSHVPVQVSNLVLLPQTPSSTAPTGLAVTSTSDTTATITWDTKQGASGYNIYVEGILYASSLGSPQLITDLEPGTTYSISITSISSGVESTPSTVSITTTGSTTGTQTSNTTPYSTTLEWPAYPGATKYGILQDGVLIGTTTKTTYTVYNLVPATQYTFTIVVNPEDTPTTTYSPILITTAEPGQATQAPSPTVNTANTTSTGAQVYWDIPPESDPTTTSYNVYNDGSLVGHVEPIYDGTGEPPTQWSVTEIKSGVSDTTHTVDSTLPYFELTNLEPSKTYEVTTTTVTPGYQAQPVSDTPVESAPSSPVYVTTQAQTQTGIKASQPTQYSVTLNWPAYTDAISYNVYQDGNKIDTTTNTTYTINNLQPGTTYTFKITVNTSSGEVSPYDPINITTEGTTSNSIENGSENPVILCSPDLTQYYDPWTKSTKPIKAQKVTSKLDLDTLTKNLFEGKMLIKQPH